MRVAILTDTQAEPVVRSMAVVALNGTMGNPARQQFQRTHPTFAEFFREC